MNKYIIIIFWSIVLTAGSCKFNEELRTDPVTPSTAPLSTLVSASQAGIAYTMGGNQARFNNMFTQHLAGVDRQALSIGRFNLSQQDTDDTWDNYYRIIYNLKTVQTQSTTDGSPHYAGIARILTAICLGNSTDLWGDIPYSDAIKGTTDALQPKFDTQESIYNSIQSLLDAAITDLSAPTSILKPGADDLYYGGNIGKWKAAAYALKARYFLHLKKRISASLTQSLVAIQASGFVNNTNNMFLAFPGISTTTQAPLYQFSTQRAGDVKMARPFVNLLKSINDPRLFEYVDSTGIKNDTTKLIGAQPGISNLLVADAGPYINSPESSVFIITYAELKFIEAEAAFDTDKARAALAYNDAVKASILQVTGEAAPTEYVTANASETSATLSLEKIMTQKYIAMFMHPETFTDVRRTNLPVLTAPVDNVTSGQYIRRWPYPLKEKNLNGGNVPNEQNIPTLGRVWWDMQ